MPRIFISCDVAPGTSLDLIQQALPGAELVRRRISGTETAEDSTMSERQAKERIWGCAATLVLIEKAAARSDTIKQEIKWSLTKAKPNGLVGVLLEPLAEVPTELIDCGAEIVPLDPILISSAIIRSLRAAGRAVRVEATPGEPELCARSPEEPALIRVPE